MIAGQPGGGSRTPTANPAQPQRRRGVPPPPRVPHVSVSKLVPSERLGNVKSFASVVFVDGPITLRVNGWRIVQEPGKKPWIGAPSQERLRQDRKTGQTVARFYPVVELPESWHKAACAAVLAAWERYEATGALPQSSEGRRTK